MMGVGIIWLWLFWGGLILLAIWLITVLFPVSPQCPPDTPPDTSVGPQDRLD